MKTIMKIFKSFKSFKSNPVSREGAKREKPKNTVVGVCVYVCVCMYILYIVYIIYIVYIVYSIDRYVYDIDYCILICSSCYIKCCT